MRGFGGSVRLRTRDRRHTISKRDLGRHYRDMRAKAERLDAEKKEAMDRYLKTMARLKHEESLTVWGRFTRWVRRSWNQAFGHAGRVLKKAA